MIIEWIDIAKPIYSLISERTPILSTESNQFEILLENYLPSYEFLSIQWSVSPHIVMEGGEMSSQETIMYLKKDVLMIDTMYNVTVIVKNVRHVRATTTHIL